MTGSSLIGLLMLIDLRYTDRNQIQAAMPRMPAQINRTRSSASSSTASFFQPFPPGSLFSLLFIFLLYSPCSNLPASFRWFSSVLYTGCRCSIRDVLFIRCWQMLHKQLFTGPDICRKSSHPHWKKSYGSASPGIPVQIFLSLPDSAHSTVRFPPPFLPSHVWG